MGDIQAMFYQVRVPQEHWNYQRFLWWPEGDYSQPPVKYMMCVYMFGTTSSPSCANAALMKTAMDNENNFDPETANIVRNNFYVDDCLLPAPSTMETVRHVSQVSEMCKKGGFLLTKWVSNSCEVLDRIPEDTRAVEVKDMNFELEDMPTERALGVCWTVNSDSLGFKITESVGEATRRQILSVVSSVYDPLGLVSPFVLKAKILLQELCRQGLGWSKDLEQVSVPRCYKQPDFGPVNTCQLHMFSDASCDGYGVAAYVRFTNDKDEVHCSLIKGKARVSPLKKVTIPRLELTTACIAVRLSYIVQRELQYHFSDTFYWTDSMSVIKYINNETSRFQTFVANRIAMIRDGSHPEQWRYTPTECNPADAASRGLTIDNLLKCDQWFQGSRFLWEVECEWPPTDHSEDVVDENDQEIKKSVNMTMVDDSVDPMTRLFNASSSWWKLKKIVGWIIVYMKKLQHLVKQRKTKVLNNSEQDADRKTVHEAAQSVKLTSRTKSDTMTRLSPVILQKAEMAIIRYVQMQQFPSVLKVLRSTRQDSKNNSQIGKPIRKLDPILVDGVIRVDGRLDRACIPYEAKHPVLLPKLSPVSKLIIQESRGTHGESCDVNSLATAILDCGSWIFHKEDYFQMCGVQEVQS